MPPIKSHIQYELDISQSKVHTNIYIFNSKISEKYEDTLINVNDF